MIGSIIGDIIGSPYEGNRVVQDKRNFKPLFLGKLSKFTDDTNLTIAVADALLTGVPFEDKYLEWYNKNPYLGYGSSFKTWVKNKGRIINTSNRNGCAMRISPIAFVANNLNLDFYGKCEWAYLNAINSINKTHNCTESEEGVLSLISTMILAWGGKYKKEEIKSGISSTYKYNLSETVENIRNTWPKKDTRCKITVPQALICFFESNSFESAIQNAIYSGGDVDTIAAMTGGIAEYYYGVETIDRNILAETKNRLQPEMINIINTLYKNKLNW